MSATHEATGHRPARRPWLRGLGVTLLGAVVVVIGAIQTTSSTPSSSCPANTELVAKFNFENGVYVFEKPAGNAGVVTITNGTATGGDASSTIPLSAVIVKGGQGAVIVTYSPPQSSVHFSNANLPPVGSGNIPDISNVQFCGGTSSETTTTTTPDATTTTVVESTTTTDDNSTTTTNDESTTTTNESTTTTNDESTTTTEGDSTTTTNDESTTTTNDESTTTTNDESTTTTGDESTTSSTASDVGAEPPSAADTTTTTSIALVSPPVTSISVIDTDEPLPSTGSPSVPLIVLGTALMIIGLTLVVVGQARARRASNT